MGHFRAREARAGRFGGWKATATCCYERPRRAFASMRTHASLDGVRLTPVSGFRDVDRQHGLFFAVAADRGKVCEARARLGAPRVFEHHTGYALDISCPEVGDDLVVAFEKTGAFARALAAPRNTGSR